LAQRGGDRELAQASGLGDCRDTQQQRDGNPAFESPHHFAPHSPSDAWKLHISIKGLFVQVHLDFHIIS
jgi:hypothetical protein